MDLETYKQVYQAQAMPESKRKLIQNLAGVMILLEGLAAIALMLWRADAIYESFVALAMTVLGMALTALFCVVGWMLYRAYYQLWMVPLRSAPLKVAMTLGAIAFVYTFNLAGVIILIVMFAAVIPRNKADRERQVAAASGVSAVGSTVQATSSSAVGAPVQVASNNVGVSVSAQPVASASPLSAMGPSAQAPMATIRSGRELGVAATLLAFAVIQALWSVWLAYLFMEGIENNSAYSAARGFVLIVGVLFFVVGLVGVAIVFAISMIRTRMLVKYQQQVACQSAMTIHAIVKVLSAVSVIAFLVFLVYGVVMTAY